MEFYMACIAGHKKGFGVDAAARVLIAENYEKAHEAAMHNCIETFPEAEEYVIHEAFVEKLLDEKTDLVMEHPNGERYILNLTKKEE